MVKAYENTNDKWRAFGYQKAIMALRKYPKEVTTWEVKVLYDRFVRYYFDSSLICVLMRNFQIPFSTFLFYIFMILLGLC